MKAKTIIFYLLNLITGAASLLLLVCFFCETDIREKVLSFFPYMVGVDFVYFILLFFLMSFVTVDASNYNTTTTTYTMNSSGEVDTYVSTPEDKAGAATIWARLGLSVLCTCTMGVSHSVFLFVIPIKRMRGGAKIAVSIILGILIFAVAAIYPVFPALLQKIRQTEADRAYGPSELTYIEYDDGYAVEGCDKSAKSIVIPAKHNYKPVTAINIQAFRDCKYLTSVTIPNSVKSIGGLAFYDCASLTSVTIPDSVTTIENYAFYGCASLTSITIPDGITTIEYYTFAYCSALTNVPIPEGVTNIGDAAFIHCSALTTVAIPDGVTGIGKLAFYECSSLTTVTIPNSVTNMGTQAFCDCPALTRIEFKGTKAQWEAINKGALWIEGSDNCEVYFTEG